MVVVFVIGGAGLIWDINLDVEIWRWFGSLDRIFESELSAARLKENSGYTPVAQVSAMSASISGPLPGCRRRPLPTAPMSGLHMASFVQPATATTPP